MGNNDYEFELVSRLFIGINTLLNPRHACKVGLKQSDFIKLEEAAAVLEKFCFCAVYGGGEFTEAHTEDKAEPEEVPAEDEDKAEPEEVPAEDEDEAEPEEVPAEDEDEAEPEEVPAEDEDEAEPEEVPAEDEDEAEPEQVLSNKKCFSNAHCCTSDCPNIRFDIAENRFGYGIAEDMGFERISCKECYYNTGKCEDCLFFNGSDCFMFSDPEPYVYHGLD